METTAMAIDTRDGAGASKGYLVAMMAFPLFLLGLHSSLQLIPLPATAFVPHGDVIVAPMSGTALAALRAGTRGPSCTPYRCHRRYSAAGAPATMPVPTVDTAAAASSANAYAGTVTSTSSTTARLPTRTESAEAAVMSSQAGSRPCWDTSSASAGSSQMPISRTDARLSSSTRPVHTAHEPQYTSQRDAYDCAPLTGLDEMD